MRFIVKVAAYILAIWLASYILPGVYVSGWEVLILVAVSMIVMNEVIYPLLKLITLPITILTLGLFALVLNLLFIKVIDYLILGFSVEGILTVLLFSLIVSLVTSVLGGRTRKRRKKISRRRN